jgi:peptidyl-prolyl cis-trans isomerase SurA
MKTERKVKLIMVTNRINEHILIKAIGIKTRNITKEKQIKAMRNFDETIKNTYVKVLVEYRDCDFTNNWLKKFFIFF